jgi:lycopene beta-cyclase
MKHYNYIFAGAGLASLMTAYRMAVSGAFEDKSIFLIDTDTKKTNDRTWCFWEKDKGFAEAIVYQKWNTALFADDKKRTDLDFDGYQYKMIRGTDFYSFVFSELQKHPNITFVQQKVIDFADSEFNVLVKTETENYTCNKLFNSIYNPELGASQTKYPLLQQHFIGWHVKTTEPVFDAEKPVFMDFSIPQKSNTRFMYVLPFSDSEAIVEYTLFSKDLLAETEYEKAIEDYLENLGVSSYEIVAEERGSIPMTSYPFWKHNTKNILNIGTAGGWTKASTGYTFKNSDKLSAKLVQFLKTGNNFTAFHKKRRFWFYDLLLLDILARTNQKGSEIFSAMFRSGKAAPIFKFLDEETSFSEDLGVIFKCPKPLFLAALLRRNVNL